MPQKKIFADKFAGDNEKIKSLFISHWNTKWQIFLFFFIKFPFFPNERKRKDWVVNCGIISVWLVAVRYFFPLLHAAMMFKLCLRNQSKDWLSFFLNQKSDADTMALVLCVMHSICIGWLSAQSKTKAKKILSRHIH